MSENNSNIGENTNKNTSYNTAENTPKKKKIKFGELFNNEKFLMIFSIVLSFCLWVAISASSGETVNYTLNDVPVTMELSDDAVAEGLTVVSINGVPVEDFKTSVKVTGNSVTVGSLTTSDIQIYGSNLGNIVTSGTYNVTLAARSQGVKSNYSIVSVNPTEVTLVVDRNIEKELEIESQITASAPAEYYIGSPTFSSKTVAISGPEQSVSKVAKAVVSYKFDSELTKTVTLHNLDVMLLDANGGEVKDESLIVEPVSVDATIPVLSKKTVPIEITYDNKPSGIDINDFISIEPNVIDIAAADDVLSTIDSITVGPLDFNTLNYGTDSMEFEVVMPEGVRNLNSIETVKVRFKFSNMSSVSREISAFQFVNVPDGLVAEYSTYSSIKVTFIGYSDEIESLEGSDISATIDLTDAAMGTFDMPVTVKVAGISSCWAYGTYSVNVTIKDAASTVPVIGTDSSTDKDSVRETDKASERSSDNEANDE